MPSACDPAFKTLVQTLVLQGYSAPAIAERTGAKVETVRTWTKRFKWGQARDKAKQDAVQTCNSALGQVAESAIEKHSQGVRNGLAKRLVHAVSQLPITPLTLKSELALQERLEPLVRNARTIFGWQDSHSTPSVRISLLAQTLVSVDNKHPLSAGTMAGSEGGNPFEGGGVRTEAVPQNFPVLEASVIEPSQPVVVESYEI